MRLTQIAEAYEDPASARYAARIWRTFKYVADHQLIPELFEGQHLGSGADRDFTPAQSYLIMLGVVLIPSLKRPMINHVAELLYRYGGFKSEKNVDYKAILSGQAKWSDTPVLTVADGVYARFDASPPTHQQLYEPTTWYALGFSNASGQPHQQWLAQRPVVVTQVDLSEPARWLAAVE